MEQFLCRRETGQKGWKKTMGLCSDHYSDPPKGCRHPWLMLTPLAAFYADPL